MSLKAVIAPHVKYKFKYSVEYLPIWYCFSLKAGWGTYLLFIVMRVIFLGIRYRAFLPHNLVSYPAQTLTAAMQTRLISVGLVTDYYIYIIILIQDFAKINSGASCHPSAATGIPGSAAVDGPTRSLFCFVLL